MAKRNYVIAWQCLLVCLRNNYDLRIWLCPIPAEHKEKMLEAGRRFLEKEKARENESFLFSEVDFEQNC